MDEYEQWEALIDAVCGELNYIDEEIERLLIRRDWLLQDLANLYDDQPRIRIVEPTPPSTEDTL